MTQPRLEFGNPDHIRLAEDGQECKCGHIRANHLPFLGSCGKTEECTCDNCDDDHEACECEEFIIKT